MAEDCYCCTLHAGTVSLCTAHRPGFLARLVWSFLCMLHVERLVISAIFSPPPAQPLSACIKGSYRASPRSSFRARPACETFVQSSFVMSSENCSEFSSGCSQASHCRHLAMNPSTPISAIISSARFRVPRCNPQAVPPCAATRHVSRICHETQPG